MISQTIQYKKMDMWDHKDSQIGLVFEDATLLLYSKLR